MFEAIEEITAYIGYRRYTEMMSGSVDVPEDERSRAAKIAKVYERAIADMAMELLLEWSVDGVTMQ